MLGIEPIVHVTFFQKIVGWLGAKVFDFLITGHRSADTQWTAMPVPPLYNLP